MRVALQKPHAAPPAAPFRVRTPAQPIAAIHPAVPARAATPLAPVAEPVLQRCSCGGTCPRCRAAGHHRHAEEGAPPEVHQALRSGGQPLPADTRGLMESRFAHDFSRVRVHTEAGAARTARALDARAYTVGRDIVFAPGEYAPQTAAGRHLLAHELAHTIQQGGLSSPPLQARLRMDAPSDAAETAAARAADAVMRGGPAPALAPVSAGTLQRARTCTRGAESEGVTTVTCTDDSGTTEYDVTTVVTRGRVPSTETDALAGLDRGTLYLRVRVCRGRDEVVILSSMEVEQPLRTLIENLLRGSGAVAGVRLEPEMRITWTRSSEFEAEVYGGPIMVGGVDRTGGRGGIRGRWGGWEGGLEIGSDPTLATPGGDPEIHVRGTLGRRFGRVDTVDCFEETETITYRCRPVTYTPEVEAIPPDDVQAYVFFRYATAEVIDPTPRFFRGGTEVGGMSFATLAAEGYRARSIDGHTSPEGPRGEPRRPGGFMGNEALSRERAAAARTYLEGRCGDCIAAEPAVVGEGELYTADRAPGRELEGDPLTRRAREGFLGTDDATPDPLATQEDAERLPRESAARQRDSIYPRLRRAIIHLHREGTPGRAPERQSGAEGECVPEVRRAMQGR